MAKKKLGTTATVPAPPGSDDFKLIKGIGPSIEQRLHNADILTFAQLATLSTEDIAEVLGNDPLLSAEHIEKQDWIGQARVLGAEAGPVPTGELTIPNGRQRLATFTVELLLGKDGHVRRTHIVHIQDGQKDTWSSWDDKRLVGFIVEHTAIQQESRASDTIAERPLVISATGTPPSEALAMRPSAAEEPQADLQLQVAQVSVAQVPAQQGESVPESLMRLRAHVDFRLSGTAADQVTANESAYAVQALACELGTGQTLVLNETHERLRPGVLDYTSAVEFTLPSAGRYQIMGLVLLPHDNAASAGLGPVLKIVSGDERS